MRRSAALALALALALTLTLAGVVGCASAGRPAPAQLGGYPAPRWCGPAPAPQEGLWVIVVSEPCAACRRLMQALEASGARVAVIVAYADTCAQARPALGGRSWPYAPARGLEAAWGVESTPEAFVVEGERLKRARPALRDAGRASQAQRR